MSSSRLRIFDWLLDALTSVAFVAGVSLPAIATHFWPTSFNEGAERRHAAPPPEWNKGIDAQLPGQIERWFSDHFGFRAELVRFANLTRIRMGVSPSPQVIVGKDGFFFFAGERSLEQYRRAQPFSDAELGELRSRLQARRDFLALRGIQYLVVFLPNKETIYPDKMPRRIGRAPRSARLDQLYAELRTSSTVEAVDVRDVLLDARRTERVYHYTDTHWNGIGAFVAYGAIAKTLSQWFPAVVPIERSATLMTRGKRGGDLGGMMGLPDDVFEQDFIDVAPRHARARETKPPAGVPPDPSPYTKPRAFAVDDPALPRLLVFRDSFFTGMIPMLAENFRHSLILSGHAFDPAMIDLQRPDVVIEEVIERYIMLGAPENPPALADPDGALRPSENPLGLDEAPANAQLLPSLSAWSPHDLDAGAGSEWVADGPNPSFTSPEVAFDAALHQRIWVRLIAKPSNEAQRRTHRAVLCWRPPDVAEFTAQASQPFVVLVDGAAHEYRVLPALSRSYEGKIGRLRLDLPTLEPGIRYELIGVRIEK